MSNFQTGTYQHYKGNKYLVLGVAKHSETLEDLVVYISLYENDLASMWVRPLKMFTENVVVDGKSVPRFRKLD
ncbi:DUF1653 domain-containing protein [Patescibacteria group bacterium]|nr:DUF1653 domain-containing protein [Patescibacteria group bacterium]